MVSHEGMRVRGHDSARSQSTNRILDEPRWCLRPIDAVLDCLNHLDRFAQGFFGYTDVRPAESRTRRAPSCQVKIPGLETRPCIGQQLFPVAHVATYVNVPSEECSHPEPLDRVLYFRAQHLL